MICFYQTFTAHHRFRQVRGETASYGAFLGEAAPADSVGDKLCAEPAGEDQQREEAGLCFPNLFSFYSPLFVIGLLE